MLSDYDIHLITKKIIVYTKKSSIVALSPVSRSYLVIDEGGPGLGLKVADHHEHVLLHVGVGVRLVHHHALGVVRVPGLNRCLQGNMKSSTEKYS